MIKNPWLRNVFYELNAICTGRYVRRSWSKADPGQKTLSEKQLKQKGLGTWLQRYSACLASMRP
jgi:hypothetical protein